MTQLEDTAASGSGPPPEGASDAREEIRAYWDVDATTYDLSPHHRPRSSAEQAAWAATLARVLPPAPARVLDVGAGTGFLSLLAAGLGHHVTAHDLSPGMLARLAEKAEAAGLEVTVSEGAAEEPPAGPFDAVIERHLLWTLPRPRGHARRAGAGSRRAAGWSSSRASGVPVAGPARRSAAVSASACGGCGASPPTTTAATTPPSGSSCPSAPARRPRRWSNWSRRPAGPVSGWSAWRTWSGPPDARFRGPSGRWA